MIKQSHQVVDIAIVCSDFDKSLEFYNEKLGFEPGHTTHLLAETSSCHRIIGLDRSEAFVLKAAKLLSYEYPVLERPAVHHKKNIRQSSTRSSFWRPAD